MTRLKSLKKIFISVKKDRTPNLFYEVKIKYRTGDGKMEEIKLYPVSNKKKRVKKTKEVGFCGAFIITFPWALLFMIFAAWVYR